MERNKNMIQKIEYSSPGDNSDAKRRKQENKRTAANLPSTNLSMVVLVIIPRQLIAKASAILHLSVTLWGKDL
ncbi:hypothetical protein Tco_0839374 [Tanacetum coccineum]|uniref:Uncharacterized protein n=1 Tax=Tanacetum coccineum TaxID=301880 RepID=A0ABQ5AT92_9ASTR